MKVSKSYFVNDPLLKRNRSQTGILDEAADKASLNLKLCLVSEAKMSEAENWFQFCSVSFSSDGLKKVEIFHFEQKMSWRKFSLAIFFSFPRNSNLPPFFAARCLLVGMKNVALRCRGSGYLGNAIYLAINYPSYKIISKISFMDLAPIFFPKGITRLAYYS